MKVQEAAAEVGWRIYPFPPAFWRRTTVQALDPQLAYLGPLPQSSDWLAQIVGAHLLPAYVYVIQDIEGDVLYVGKTINPIGRLAKHRATKEWWPRPGLLTLLGIEAGNRAEANGCSLRLEAIAIREVGPRYNVMGVVR